MNTGTAATADRCRPSDLAPPFKAEFDLDCTELQYNPYSKVHITITSCRKVGLKSRDLISRLFPLRLMYRLRETRFFNRLST
jgi:hypothetical protein